MPQLQFSELTFREKENERKVRINLLKNFFIEVDKAELEQISPFTIDANDTLTFENVPEKVIGKKFDLLFLRHLNELRTRLTKNRAFYIHKNTGIPLIGNVAFGIVYRDSSIVELKPQTSCNLNCTYCSVGEGIYSKRNDYIVDRGYMMEEFTRLLNFIDEPVEVNIGVQGEPFLYADFIPLVADLSEFDLVHTITTDTNGALLTKQIIDELAQYPKFRANISLNSLKQETAQKLAGTAYNLAHVKEMIAYAAQKINVLVAPLWIPGFNDDDIPEVVSWVKTLDIKNAQNAPSTGIQNFLSYKTGRNPVRPASWETFHKKLDGWEQQTGVKLKLTEADFNIKKTAPLPKPFIEGDVITATIALEDRFPNSRIAIAQDRTISIPDCATPVGKKVRVKITRDKHNVFVGKIV